MNSISEIQLHPRGIYVVYFIMNVVMMLNPVSFIFTTKNDVEIQEPIIANVNSRF